MLSEHAQQVLAQMKAPGMTAEYLEEHHEVRVYPEGYPTQSFGFWILAPGVFESICAASRAVGAGEEGCELHRELNELWRKYQEPVKAPWPSEEAASDLMRALVTAGRNGEPLAPVIRKALFPAAPEEPR